MKRDGINPPLKKLFLQPVQSSPPWTYDPPPESPMTPVSSKSETSSTTSASNLFLRPCHICHRRPTARAVLDAYGDCDLCEQRVCYICVRVCEGISCRRRFDKSHGSLPIADTRRNTIFERRRICRYCAMERYDEEGYEKICCLACVSTERIWKMQVKNGHPRSRCATEETIYAKNVVK